MPIFEIATTREGSGVVKRKAPERMLAGYESVFLVETGGGLELIGGGGLVEITDSPDDTRRTPMVAISSFGGN